MGNMNVEVSACLFLDLSLHFFYTLFLPSLITVSSIQNPFSESHTPSIVISLHGYAYWSFFFFLHVLNQGITSIAFHFIPHFLPKSSEDPSRFFLLFGFPSECKEKHSVQSVICSGRQVWWFGGNEGDDRDAFVLSLAFSFTVHRCSSWRYSLISLAIQCFDVVLNLCDWLLFVSFLLQSTLYCIFSVWNDLYFTWPSTVFDVLVVFRKENLLLLWT